MQEGKPGKPPLSMAEGLSTGEWLAALAGLDHDAEDYRKGVSDGSLSSFYVRLARERQTLQQLQSLTGEKRLVQAALDNTGNILSAIREFYADYIRRPWLGDESAFRSPDVIVILGASRPALDQRLAHALPIVQQFEDSPVILSGGGRTVALESQIMRDYFVEHGVAERRLIMEQDSLDTVGNAVFSGFAMREQGIGEGGLLLVTSDFHAPRALFMFRSVLGSPFRVAVSSAPSNGKNLAARIEHELKEEALAVRDLLHWSSIAGEPPRPVKDICDVFFQLLLRHKLYAARWDLARRYCDQCKLLRHSSARVQEIGDADPDHLDADAQNDEGGEAQ